MKMLCEKCKNKKATLFYADEGGGRHSLCVSCAGMLGKAERFTASEAAADAAVYRPETLYTHLTPFQAFPCANMSVEKNIPTVCGKCGTAYTALVQGAPMGCADCYAIYPFLMPPKTVAILQDKHRMPLRHRKRLEKELAVKALQAEIKKAVAEENYELAATLRDKIKKLNGTSVS